MGNITEIAWTWKLVGRRKWWKKGKSQLTGGQWPKNGGEGSWRPSHYMYMYKYSYHECGEDGWKQGWQRIAMETVNNYRNRSLSCLWSTFNLWNQRESQEMRRNVENFFQLFYLMMEFFFAIATPFRQCTFSIFSPGLIFLLCKKIPEQSDERMRHGSQPWKKNSQIPTNPFRVIS